MRIAAVLSVKDEAELIGRAVGHLRAIGIDHIIACDMGSTDGTFEILERHSSDRDFWLFRLSDQEADHFETWSRANLALAKSARVDWVMFLDADEFWIPATGTLRNCAGLATADVLSVERFNVPLGPQGAIIPETLGPETYPNLLLLTQSMPDLCAHLEQNPTVPWIWGAPENKVMARPERIAAVDLGAHDVIPGDPASLQLIKAKDVVIAHLPFTTRGRFTRKINNVRAVFRVHNRFFGDSIAWHWRRWVKLAEQGKLEDEFDRTVFDDRTIADLRARGAIRSAAEIFQETRAGGERAFPPGGPPG